MVALSLLLACHPAPCVPTAWDDADGDGSGDPARPRCEAGPRTAPDGLDCDDSDPAVHPGAPEACDGVDQDCDGWPDDHPDPPRYVDRDGDGFGSEALPSCDAWGVDAGGDCDDADPFLNPDTPWFADRDGDGAGAEEVARSCADPGGGAVRVAGDCDDDDPDRSPLARETCGGEDQDCDPTNDASGAWMVPDADHRIPLIARGAHDVPLVVALEDLPPGARVFVQDCAAPRELPAVVLAGAGDPWIAGADGGEDVLVALWDEDGELGTVEAWPDRDVALAVYVGGAPGPAWDGPLSAGDTDLVDVGFSLGVDPARGALLDAVADATGVLAGQAQATAGNGLRTSAGPLSIATVPGDAARADASPITAALTTRASASDAAGSFTYSATWRVFAGRPAALGRLTMVADAPTAIAGTDDRTEPLRPLQLRSPLAASCAVDPGRTWGDLSVGDRGLTWAWVSPPRWTNFAGCGPAETWAAANDLPEGDPGRGATGTVPLGQSIVDGAVVVLLAHGPGGPGGAAARRDAWVRGVLTTVGPTEP